MFWKYDWKERKYDVSTDRKKYASSFRGKGGSALILEIDIRSAFPRSHAADGEDYFVFHKIVSALYKYCSCSIITPTSAHI